MVADEVAHRADDERLTKIVADALLRHWDRQDAMSLEGCCAAVAVRALRNAGALIDGDGAKNGR